MIKKSFRAYNTNNGDIFDYIPAQKTNQIFTPKPVVKDMVDRLEKELRETKEELQKQIAEKQVPAPVVAAAPALDISKLTDGFEFHGYGRAGVLINQDGDKGNAFNCLLYTSDAADE